MRTIHNSPMAAMNDALEYAADNRRDYWLYEIEGKVILSEIDLYPRKSKYRVKANEVI